MTQIYNWIGRGVGATCSVFYSNRRRTKIHVEVENSKFSSVNGDVYGIQLTLVWPISLSRDLAISPYSVSGSGGHSKSSNIVCMSTLPACIKQFGPKQPRKGGDHIIALIRLQITMFASSSPDIRPYS